MSADPFPTDGASPIRRSLLCLVSLVCRFPRTALALSLGLATLSAYAACFHLEYHTQRSDLVSPDKEHQRRWQAFVAEFGEDDDVVVVVEGADRARMRQAIEAVAAGVRRHPELFDRLFYKVDLRHLKNRALLYLPTREVRKIHRQVEGMAPLLALAPLSWRQLGLGSLLGEGSARAAALRTDEPLGPSQRAFFGRLKRVSDSARATLDDPAAYRNPWAEGGMASSLQADGPDRQEMLDREHYFFSDDGSLAFLLARPLEDRSSFTAARENVEALRAVVAGVRADFPDLDFGVTGMPVLENDEMVAAGRDTRLAFWLALAGVTLLYFLVYRRAAYPLFTVGTLLVGTAWAMGWAALTVGHLNILSATFAVMLIGTGDYGVLWVMRYDQARLRGMDVRPALLHTANFVALGNLTASTTLALAFFAAMLADLKAIAELGWIAGCGILFCAFACFTVLPAVLVLFDRRSLAAGEGMPLRLADEQPTAADDAWLPWLGRRPGWVLGVGGALVLFFGACATRVTYDHNLLHLQPRGLDAVAWELKLLERTSGTSWHALSYRDTPEEALALKARFEKLPGVGRVVEVASLIPPDQETKLPLLRDLRARLGVGLPPAGVRIVHPLPDPDAVRKKADRLAGRLRHPELAGVRASLLALCDGLRDAQDKGETARRLQRFDERLAGDLAEDLHRLRAVSVPEHITLGDVPPALAERQVSPHGRWLLRVYARDNLWEFPALVKFTEEVRQVDPEATGQPFGTVEGLEVMKGGLTRAGLYAFLVIVVVLLLDFRSIPRALVAVAPLVLGVVLTLGVLGLYGLPLNPANMIAFPLVIGVGVDNGVHVLHDWLLRRARGRSTVSRALGRGVLVKSLTAMIGFGTLMPSAQRGLAGLGFILTLGVGTSLLAALVLLPAALYRRAGRIAPAMPTDEEEAPRRLAA
jgi:hopanoid biosynthesis associated RND transporter like protein HpnN